VNDPLEEFEIVPRDDAGKFSNGAACSEGVVYSEITIMCLVMRLEIASAAEPALTLRQKPHELSVKLVVSMGVAI
jgi:hypothetical protein